MEKVYFQEEQRLDLWIRLPFLLLAIGTTVTFGYGCYHQFVMRIPWGDKPMQDQELVILSIIINLTMWIVFMLFFLARFTTRITDDGIYIKFPPFQIKMKHISIENIQKYEVRRYSPLREYGGFGVKDSLRKFGKGYIATGNQGLQLYLVDGKKVLLGTQKPDSIRLAVNRMMDQKEMR